MKTKYANKNYLKYIYPTSYLLKHNFLNHHNVGLEMCGMASYNKQNFAIFPLFIFHARISHGHQNSQEKIKKKIRFKIYFLRYYEPNIKDLSSKKCLKKF